MLRFALLAVGAAVIVAIGLVFWPMGGSRPDSHLAGPAATAPDPSTFVVHDAAPPAPPAPGAAAPATPPSAGDLDAVMQRLRDAAAQKQAAQAGAPAVAPAQPPAAAPGLTVTAPAPGAPIGTAPGTASLAPGTPPGLPGAVDAAPPPNRWTNVTGQGTRWRMVRSGIGYTVSIDLGGGQVADVHVLPAFANLDPASINVRVDYLKDTILQSFSSQSASYSFARDGSVALEH